MDVILLGDISYGIAVRRDLPAIVARIESAPMPQLTRVAVSSIEERDPGKVVSGKPGYAWSGRNEGNRRPVASAEAANEGVRGCGWKLTYDGDLNRLFLDLVERDSNALVMRIPRESLVKFLRSVSFASARPLGGSGAQCDLLA
jgi:hypothetical protein